MKNLFHPMLALGILAIFSSCQKDGLLSTAESLINTIANSDSKELVAAADLSNDITTYVERNHAPVSVEAAWKVDKAGYEVALEDGQLLYFNEKRTFLGRNDGSTSPRGDRHCLRGEDATTEDLPQAALDYLAANYADDSILTVKLKRFGYFAVELSGGDILIFNGEGEFIRLCGEAGGPHGPGGPGGPGGGHQGGHPCGCMSGDTIDVSELPTTVTDYVTASYPDETIQNAVLKPSGKFAAELSDGSVLLFDADGNFIKECGVVDPNGSGHGPWQPGGPGGHHGGAGPGGHGGHGIHGTQVTLEELPQAAQDYLAATYPDATLDRAVEKPNGNFFVRLSNGAKILFDAEGNVLFDSGV